MTKRSFNLRKVAVTTICLAGVIVFSGCDKSEDPNGNGNTEGTPKAVMNLTATTGNAQVSLSWDTPIDNGGSEIIGYEVTIDNWANKVTKTASERLHTYTGLTNGTKYTFKIRAVSAKGVGTESILTAIPTTNSNENSNFRNLEYRIGLWIDASRQDTLEFVNSTELIRKGKAYTYQEYLYRIEENTLIISLPNYENIKTYHSILRTEKDTVVLGNMYITTGFGDNSGTFIKY